MTITSRIYLLVSGIFFGLVCQELIALHPKKPQRSSRCHELAINFFALIVIFSLFGGCGNVVGSSSNAIKVEREVQIDGLVGDPASLAAAHDGAILVAGASWAFKTDANGKELWRYVGPNGGATKPYKKYDFGSVMALKNGNVLLCGSEWTDQGRTGLLIILNSSGQLLERRLLKPANAGKAEAVGLTRCFSWDDGVAVMGVFTLNQTGYGWLMKLDSAGVEQWEKADQRLAASEAVESVDRSLVMAESDSRTQSTNLVRVSSQGDFIATKSLPSYPDSVVSSVGPSPNVRVLTDIGREKSEIITLDQQFNAIAGPLPVIISVSRGGTWALPDGSIALFGNFFSSGVYRAAVARIGQPGQANAARTLPVPNSGSVSASVYDALPISHNTFVTVRDLNFAVVLSWVTFE